MRLILLLVLIFFCNCAIIAQRDSSVTTIDTLAPYLKNPHIPTFSIRQPDSTWFNNTNLNLKKPVLILYFSPDCGHCQLETEEIISKIKDLSNLQIIMVTSRPFEDMARFAEYYKIKRFPTIKIGNDPSRKISRFYDVKFTPFSALYDKKGKLIKAYEQEINMEELIGFVK